MRKSCDNGTFRPLRHPVGGHLFRCSAASPLHIWRYGARMPDGQLALCQGSNICREPSGRSNHAEL